MLDQEQLDEKEIATIAGRILSEKFIEVARTHTVLYVKDDVLMSKAPNGIPVIIKHLTGRNPDLAKQFISRGTFKIKKRRVKPDK